MVNYPHYNILSAEEEYNIALNSNKGDKSARDLLILSNIRFAIYYSKKFSSYSHLEEDDLIQEGITSMVCAAEKFDAKRGNKFITYAKSCIRRAILRAEEKASKTSSCSFSKLSSDEDFSEEECLSSSSNKSFAHVEDDYIDGEVRECLHKAVGALDKKEADVITRYYGLNDGKIETLTKIGESYGLTKSRISQIEKSALKNLRSSLDDFID